MKKVLMILESGVMEKLLKEALASYDVRTCSAAELADTLAQFHPDALILDLFLSRTNGFAVLEQCRDGLPPVVLVLSPLISSYILQKAQTLGVDFVILKPCTIDYIVKQLEDMLLMQRFPGRPDMGDIAEDLLHRFDFHASARVSSALIAGILMAAKDPECLLTKEIYPTLSATYGYTEGAVDQAIRRVIRKMWEHREKNPAIWEFFFPGYTECPSNGDFMFTLANYLRKNYPSRFADCP